MSWVRISPTSLSLYHKARDGARTPGSPSSSMYELSSSSSNISEFRSVIVLKQTNLTFISQSSDTLKHVNYTNTKKVEIEVNYFKYDLYL